MTTNRFTSALKNLPSLQVALDRLTVKHNSAVEAVAQERRRLRKAKQQLAAAEEAQQFAQHVAQAVQQQAHQRIAAVVSKCLRAVFGEEAYEFEIRFERKRGKTEARPVFIKDGQERHPLRASGGGVIDIASMALRLACILLAKPAGRKVLILDEPCRFVNGEEFQLQTARMFEVLAEEMQVQFIIVTDDDWLKIGRVVEVE